jgi:alpha-aminoadipate carrier protein LysW
LIVKCLECDAEISVPPDVVVGEILNCQDCGLSFEVCSIQGDKIEIKVADIEGEDWGE